jgi:hypothetical protein
MLTKTGYELWLELNGTPVTLIRPERPPHRVLARGGPLMCNVADPTVLWAWAVRHLERLIEELHFHRVRTGAVAIAIGWQDGEPTGGAARLDCPSDRFEDLLGAAREALRRAYVPDAVATHMHVIALDFCQAHGCQTSLFDAPDPKRDTVAAV